MSLRLLARELRECRDSFIKMDLEGIRNHVSYQRSLCAEIHSLDEELRVVKGRLDADITLDSERARVKAFPSQFRQVMDDLRETQNSVRRLNRVYAGLLKRSRRTINVLTNVMASHAGTYGPGDRNIWPA